MFDDVQTNGRDDTAPPTPEGHGSGGLQGISRTEALRMIERITAHDDPYWEGIVEEYYNEDTDDYPTIYDFLAPLGISREEFDRVCAGGQANGGNDTAPPTPEWHGQEGLQDSVTFSRRLEIAREIEEHFDRCDDRYSRTNTGIKMERSVMGVVCALSARGYLLDPQAGSAGGDTVQGQDSGGLQDLPRTVCLCGSSRFVDVFAVVAWILERDEHVITTGLHLLPWWYGAEEHHQAEAEGVADDFNRLHLRKIDQCNEVFVVNVDDYVGDDTRREIAYAIEQGKPIRYYMTDPVGDVVSKIAQDALGDAAQGGESKPDHFRDATEMASEDKAAAK